MDRAGRMKTYLFWAKFFVVPDLAQIRHDNQQKANAD